MARIRFILGRAGTGKTTRCVNAAADALRGEGASPLVLLTPEQATYQMEYSVLSRPGVRGFSRLRVLSFNRLGFWLNRRADNGAELSRLGRQMAVHRVLLEKAESLMLYRDAARHGGLAERISGLLTELQQADCGSEQVEAMARQLAEKDAGSATARKWQDIATIYAGYAAFFEGSSGLANSEAQLTRARGEIAKAVFLNGARVWVDGFSGFTVQERELLVEIARHAESMEIALCLDPGKIDLDNTDINAIDPAGLFYSTEQTYAELSGVFRKCTFAIEPPLILSRPHRYSNAAALGHLEAQLAEDTAEAETTTADGAVEIACCSDARAETEWIAGRISDLVRRKGYRYRQIAVAVPDMEAYGPYVESAFGRFGIPYFLDRPAMVRHHPLAETLQAALAAAEGFVTLDVLCCLKSGLARVAAEQVSQLERYCLTYGLDGEDWTSETAWEYAKATTPEDDAAMENLRRRVVGPLRELQAAIYDCEEIEAAAFVRAVWIYLERIEARETLAGWATDDPADTLGHRQTWSQTAAMLDEIERVFAGRKEPAAVFVSTLSDALGSLTIKLIPPTLDQTLVGSIERSRHPEIRAMFLAGSTQKQFPTPLSTTDVLGRHERQAAQAAGLELAEPMSRQLSMRQYLAYIALTRASEYLGMSFPQQDEKGAAVAPSVWIERLAELFSDVRITTPQDKRSVWQSGCAADLAERLAAACGKDRTPGAETDAAAYVLDSAMKSKAAAIRSAAQRVMGALRYTNEAKIAARDVLGRLGRVSAFSASRLGTFAACPFQHFARYILKLEQRPILRFEPLDAGLFYHKVIETLFARLRERGLSWATAETDELAAMCEAVIAETVEKDGTIAAFMRRQRHHRAIVEAACDGVRRFVPALAEMERAGAFRQAGSEFEFSFELSKGIILHGRIDRVDLADIEGTKAAAIFDFKRTERSVNWTKLYYGLDVQLVMYLLAIPSLPKELGAETIAGAFYVPIELSGKTLSPDKVNEKQAQFGYKAKGIFNGEFAGAFDATGGGRSRYYNVVFDKEGQPYSYFGNSGAVRRDEFQTILSYGRQKIGELAEGVQGGCITAAPYRIGKTSPCGYCDYKSVCRFDWQINDYRALAALNKIEAIEKMRSTE